MGSLPPPSDVGLLERLKLSLGSDQAFLWRERLLQERLMRNVTALQERILLYVRELIEGGCDQFAHADVAAALQVGVRTVQDALRRARGVGLLDWQAQYRPVADGRRWRTTNLYRLTMPARTPEPRPDLRRRFALVSKPVQTGRMVIRLPNCSAHCADRTAELGRPLPGFEARFAAKLREEKQRRQGQIARTSG